MTTSPTLTITFEPSRNPRRPYVIARATDGALIEHYCVTAQEVARVVVRELERMVGEGEKVEGTTP